MFWVNCYFSATVNALKSISAWDVIILSNKKLFPTVVACGF